MNKKKKSIKNVRIDLTGHRYQALTVIKYSHHQGSGAHWICGCDCGRITTVSGCNLRTGHAKSCGCLKNELIGKAHRTHGLVKIAEYKAWGDMKARCYNKKNSGFKNYGGRGITVCNEWKSSFEAFYKDMGPKPSPKHSLDRIEVNGNYEPANCKWSTRREQNNNKRNIVILTHEGETKTLLDWSESLNLPHNTLFMRLRKGWSIERALTTPLLGKGQNVKLNSRHE